MDNRNIDQTIRKPRRTKGTAFFAQRNYFALGVLAFGGISWYLYELWPESHRFRKRILDYDKNLNTENRLARKLAISDPGYSRLVSQLKVRADKREDALYEDESQPQPWFVKMWNSQPDTENKGTVSKYLKKENTPQQLSESPYKNVIHDVGNINLNNSSDLDDFKTPKTINKVSKLVHGKTEKNVKKRKKIRQPKLDQFIRDNLSHSDVNPEHLQMALALSESTHDQENTSSSQKQEAFKKVFEQFGFGYSKNKVNVATKRSARDTTKIKKSRYRFITPILNTRTDEERQTLIESKISLILGENEILQQKNTANLDIFCDSLKNFNRKKLFTVNNLDLEKLNQTDFYVSSWTFDTYPTKCGHLLKDWRKIPGRSPSPIKNVQSPNSVTEEIPPIEGSIFDWMTSTNQVQVSSEDVTLDYFSSDHKGSTSNQDETILYEYHVEDKITLQKSLNDEIDLEVSSITQNRKYSLSPETTSPLKSNENIAQDSSPKRPIVCTTPDLFDSEDEIMISPVNNLQECYDLTQSSDEDPAQKKRVVGREEPLTHSNPSKSESSNSPLNAEEEKENLISSVIIIDESLDGTEKEEGSCYFAKQAPVLQKDSSMRVQSRNEIVLSPMLTEDENVSFSLPRDSYNLSFGSQCRVEEKHSELSSTRHSDSFRLRLSAQESQPNEIPSILLEQEDFESSCHLISPVLSAEKTSNFSFKGIEPHEGTSRSSNSFNLCPKEQNVISPVILIDESFDGTDQEQGPSFLESEQYKLSPVQQENSSIRVQCISPLGAQETNDSLISPALEQSTKRCSDSFDLGLNAQQNVSKSSTLLEEIHFESNLKGPDPAEGTSVISPVLFGEDTSKLSLKLIDPQEGPSRRSDLNITEYIENFLAKANDSSQKSDNESQSSQQCVEISDEELNYSSVFSSFPIKESPDFEATDSEEVNTPENERFVIKTKNVTPMVDYDAMDTPKIVRELDKFGLKPVKRHKGVKLLKYIYESTHPIIEDENGRILKKRRISYSIPNEDIVGDVGEEEDVILERKFSKKVSSCAVPLHIVWYNFVMSNPKIRENILLYEPLSLEVLHSMLKDQGYKFNLQDLLRFLDKKCITVRVAQDKQKQ